MDRESEIVVRGGFWYADYNDERGKRQRFSLKIPGKVPFKNAYKVFEVARQERSLKRYEIQQALDDVLRFKTPQVDWKTVWAYKIIWRQFVEFLTNEGARYTMDIEPEHLAEWARMLSGKYRPATVNSKLTVAGVLMNAWHTLGRMSQFTASRFISPYRVRNIRKRDRILSAVELEALFTDPTYGPLFQFLYLSIQRIDVVIRLHSSNVNMKRGIISFPRGKGGRLQDIPLTAQLREWLEIHGKEGYLFWDDRYDIESHSDRRVVATRARRNMASILAARDFEPARIHDLRATGASLLATLVPLPVLMQYGGWETPSVVMKYYRMKPEDLQIPDLPSFRSRPNLVNLPLKTSGNK